MAITSFVTLKTAIENWLGDTSTLTSRVPEYVSLAEDDIAMDLRVRAMEKTTDLLAFQTYTASTVGGTANAITLVMPTTVTALSKGLTVKFTAESNNTSTVTLQVDGTAAKALNKDDGTVGLDADDIIDGQTYNAYYDGTRFRLIDSGMVPLPTRFVGFKRLFIAGDPNRELVYLPPADFQSRYAGSTSDKPAAFTLENEYVKLGPAPDADYIVKSLWWQRFAALSADSDTNWCLTNARGLYLYDSLKHACLMLEDDHKAAYWKALYDELVDKVTQADIRDRISGSALTMRSQYNGG